MERIKVLDREFTLYLTEDKLKPEIARVAQEIKQDVGDKNPLFVCILSGAFMFAAELMKEMNESYEMTFAKYSSYCGTCSTGELKEVIPPMYCNVKDRVVVIIEDLIDTGFTLSEIIKLYNERGAKEIKVAVMLNKPDVPKVVEINPDYVALEIPNDFIVGHGLDYNGHGRMYKDIYQVVEVPDEENPHH